MSNKIPVGFKDYSVRLKICEYIIIFFVSASFITLFSLWTSPFFKDWYGCDASFFTLVGRGITSGKVMYRDFYDLKGPYFFFIEALGQLICKGRTGAYILQIAALFASSCLIYNIALMFVNRAKSAFILIVFYCCSISTLWGGNTLEEFMLPLSLLCLYLTCRIFILADTADLAAAGIPSYIPLILGSAFCIMALSKISVSGTVLGIAAALIYMLLINRKWSELFLFLVYFLLGACIVSLPIIIYFAYNNALLEMLRCVFVIGFRRSADFAELFNITWELKCLGAVFAFVFAVLHRRRLPVIFPVMLMAMSAATYILLHLGTPFYYYFTSAYPCLILALALFLKLYDPLFIFENLKQAICLILFAVFLFYYIPTSLDTVRTVIYDRSNESYGEYVSDSKDLAALIPECDRGSVFSFLIDMQWYEINDMIPCGRFVVNVPFFIDLDENALSEIEDFLNNTPPKWILCGDCLDLNIKEAYDIIDSKYTCIYENSVGHLYLLNED